MDQETKFRELFQSLVKQLQLSPEVAQKLLQRILKILSGAGDFENKDCAQTKEESEGNEESEDTQA